MMIKSSVLNFVRDKASEGANFAELHTALKEIAANDQAVKVEQAKLDKLKADRTKAETDLKASQERLAELGRQEVQQKHWRNSMQATINSSLKAADEKALKIVEDAKTETIRIATNAARELAEKTDDLARLNQAVEAKTAAHASLTAEHAELQRKHDALQRKHDALTAGLAALKPNL